MNTFGCCEGTIVMLIMNILYCLLWQLIRRLLSIAQ